MKRLLLLTIFLVLISNANATVKYWPQWETTVVKEVYSANSAVRGYSWNISCYNTGGVGKMPDLGHNVTMTPGDQLSTKVLCGNTDYNSTRVYMVQYMAYNISNSSIGMNLTLFGNVQIYELRFSGGANSLFFYEYPNNDPAIAASIANMGSYNWNNQLCDPTNFYNNNTVQPASPNSSTCTFLGTWNNPAALNISSKFSNSTYPIIAVVMPYYPTLGGGYFFSYNSAWNLQADGYANITTTTTTTTTLPAGSCSNSSQCPSGQLCYNGSCVITNQWCFIDSDCSSGEWCNTASMPNTCESKWNNGLVGCGRNHQCLSDSCTSHAQNAGIGDYPDNNVEYMFLGACVGGNTTACYGDSDCNATEFCNMVSPYLISGGICESKRGVGQFCSNDSWCQTGYNCISSICQNQSAIQVGCDAIHPDYYWDGSSKWIGIRPAGGKAIWESCKLINPSYCPNFDSCFCGYSDENATTATCIARANANGICSLFRGSYSSIEERYQDREDACYVGYTCMGYTEGNIMRTCTSAQCRLSLPQQSNTFADQYCQQGFWCDNGICKEQNGTIPNGQTEIYNLMPSSTIVGSSENIILTGTFRYTNTSGIYGATCNISYEAARFTVNDTSSTTEINGYFTTTRFYPIATANSINSTIRVTCTKSGVPSATDTVTVTIVGTNSGGGGGNATMGSGYSCTSSCCPNGNIYATSKLFCIRYYTSRGATITDATCTLTLDGTAYTMPYNPSTGKYEILESFSYDHHTYTISCYRAGYNSANVAWSFTALSSSVTTTTLPGVCSDDIRNYHESDIDCGGTSDCPRCGYWKNCTADSDCDENLFCRLHTGTYYDINTQPINKCDHANCSDGWKNNDETGIDTGGSQCSTSCGCYSAYTIDGCNSDGSQHCNVSNSLCGFCQLDTCGTTKNCSGLYLYDNGIPTWKPRTCVNGACKWSNETGATAFTQDIYPLSGIIYQNNNEGFYLGYCSDYTNGLKVSTSKETDTQYYIGVSDYSPAITATGTWEKFGERGTYKTATIRRLCDWYGGGTLRYAKIGMLSNLPSTGIQKTQAVNMIIFRDPFMVNFTAYGDTINLTANREASFYISGAINGQNILINAAPDKSVQFYYPNITNTTYIALYANSTYGESWTHTYGKNAMYVLWFGLGLIWDVMFSWWIPSWQNWYIIPIFMSVIVGMLILAALIYFGLKQYENRNLRNETRQ